MSINEPMLHNLDEAVANLEAFGIVSLSELLVVIRTITCRAEHDCLLAEPN